MTCRFCKTLKMFGSKVSIAENRVLRKDTPPVLFIGGKPLTDYELNELKIESDTMRKTTLWEIMTSTVSAHAIDLGIKNAKDFDGTMFAKSMLHVVGILESVMKSIDEEKSRRVKSNQPLKVAP